MDKGDGVKNTRVKLKRAQYRHPSNPDIIRGIFSIGIGSLGIYPEDMTLAWVFLTYTQK